MLNAHYLQYNNKRGENKREIIYRTEKGDESSV
jgi:hypothetical protein